ncbi:hypothetical protein OUZ56_011019 [Daphnia magna]|uniref:Uncharacterized protein n=1 Tax=Daphnia magna TaxID=35525 RepID=A0ABQ9YZH4_9CRUS|nr:hypothetical protein OUZ56_011019 [Daphnia magna]
MWSLSRSTVLTHTAAITFGFCLTYIFDSVRLSSHVSFTKIQPHIPEEDSNAERCLANLKVKAATRMAEVDFSHSSRKTIYFQDPLRKISGFEMPRSRGLALNYKFRIRKTFQQLKSTFLTRIKVLPGCGC